MRPPLQICEQCQKAPVKRRRVHGKPCRYCSPTCFGAALHAVALARRRPCKTCGEPSSKARGVYCSKSCDMLDRRGNVAFERARRAGWAKAMERMRERHALRLRARLDAILGPVFAAHPSWTKAEQLALLKATLQVWRQAYNNGWKARDSRGRRKAPAA